MIGFNKVSKVAFMVSLLLGSVSGVHAMDDDITAEEWAAIARSQQEIDATEQTRATAQNNPFIQPNDEITLEEWEMIKQQAFEAEKASQEIWTRDPGRRVSMSHPQYRLRADNIPDSQINGEMQNVASLSMGRFIHNTERAVIHGNGAQLWQEARDKSIQQNKAREVVDNSFLTAERARKEAHLQAAEANQAHAQVNRLAALEKFEAKQQSAPGPVQVDFRKQLKPAAAKPAVSTPPAQLAETAVPALRKVTVKSAVQPNPVQPAVVPQVGRPLLKAPVNPVVQVTPAQPALARRALPNVPDIQNKATPAQRPAPAEAPRQPEEANQGAAQLLEQLRNGRSDERIAHNINTELTRFWQGMENLNSNRPWDHGRDDKKKHEQK